MDTKTKFEVVEKTKEEYHVVPVADSVAHDLNSDCVCGPLVLPGEEGVVVGHRSLDGREVLDK